MALSAEVINDLHIIKSTGKLKTYEAFFAFKNELETFIPNILSSDDPILRLYFVQAFPISSYVLGYILKLRNIDKVRIEIIVDDLRLFMFFDEVDMVDEFKIKIMEM
ncbi:hypothetical protein LS68_007630 [Helicobacter sp. MIT 05-5293]|uniref:hypothetical protein n=1 Tax=Helicobacter sp. MIT 05-5293 TaxID=1548149 RepID=UPI00051D0A40|nr:hypothetical protein [Helicobacter sp. MIT 05-5293]TLD80086.1 hypothetical protein LS68_007630 [Helicobacter sp. MIT 05-5293]